MVEFIKKKPKEEEDIVLNNCELRKSLEPILLRNLIEMIKVLKSYFLIYFI